MKTRRRAKTIIRNVRKRREKVLEIEVSTIHKGVNPPEIIAALIARENAIPTVWPNVNAAAAL